MLLQAQKAAAAHPAPKAARRSNDAHPLCAANSGRGVLANGLELEDETEIAVTGTSLRSRLSTRHGRGMDGSREHLARKCAVLPAN